MAGTKEIRSKIKSIKNTQKITRAMEMVAASKMRRAQERMKASRPYAERIRKVIEHLATGRLEYQPDCLIEREPKRVGFMVISSDRGLCGGLNTNLFRATVAAMRSWSDQNIPLDICTIGRKAENFFHRFGGNVVASMSNLGDRPGIQDVIGTVKVMLDAYDAQEIDRLYLVYSEFVNTMIQRPKIELLLPIEPKPLTETQYSWDYIYEPKARDLLDALMERYIESLVYQGVVESLASEQAARMVAMKNASENAAALIDDLELIYNKARQAAITRELSEIVAGASAV